MKKISYIIFGLFIILMVLIAGYKELFEEPLEDPCADIKDNEMMLAGDVFVPKKEICYYITREEKVHLCYELGDLKQKCITYVAVKKLDSALCESINDPVKVMKCERMIKQSLEQNINNQTMKR